MNNQDNPLPCPLEPTETYIKLKQSRVYVLAVLELPEWLRERTAQEDLIRMCGSFLIGFNSFPAKGLVFPYENNIWLIHHEPIQQPTRYYSRTKKSPAIIKPLWVGNYDGIVPVDVLVELNFKDSH